MRDVSQEGDGALCGSVILGLKSLLPPLAEVPSVLSPAHFMVMAPGQAWDQVLVQGGQVVEGSQVARQRLLGDDATAALTRVATEAGFWDPQEGQGCWVDPRVVGWVR